MPVTASHDASTQDLAVTGDIADNAITISRDVPGALLVNGGAEPISGGPATVANTDLIVVSGDLGNDTITLDGTNGALPAAELLGGGGDDTLVGGSGRDVLNGGTGDDVAIGGGGNDVLDGGTGADTLIGQSGDDWFFVDNAADVVVEGVDNGSDRVFASSSYALAAGQHIETLSTAASTGTAAINLTGNSLANPIIGNAGNNILDGGAGADTLYGYGGDDFLYVDNVQDQVFEGAGNGADRVFTSVSYALGAGQHVETMSTTNNAGTAAINLTGNELANTILGNAGNNTLDGGAGVDTLYGNIGDDWFYVDNAADVVFEGAGDGTDRVLTSVSYTLGVGVHAETLSTTSDDGTAEINLTGNAFDNVLIGNAGNNILHGGPGADTMHGNGGDDTFYVENAADVVIESAGMGTDQVFASTSFVLGSGAHVEALSITNSAAATPIDLTGNELANTLVGNAGVNRLDGGRGDDVMSGLGGNDTYYIDSPGDVVIEPAGMGFADEIITRIDYTLPPGLDVERVKAFGSARINLTGNDQGNVLVGSNGNNILDGGIGADAMLGEAGDDWYFVDNVGDTLGERYSGSSGGVDRVFTSVSYTLWGDYFGDSRIETLSTTNNAGTDAINLTGSADANTILGNAGNNRLDGRGGADTLYGYGGDDWLYVDNAGDVVFEGAGAGADRVFTTLSYTLSAGAHVETMSTTDSGLTSALDLTGNEHANTLIANAGDNILDGRGGADTLYGYGGADSFRFSTTLGGGNVDTIHGFNPADDTIQLDDAVFTGLAPGALAPGAFHVGAAAANADDRIVYNSATGALWFDADGSGAGAAVQFALLQGGLAVTAADFFVG